MSYISVEKTIKCPYCGTKNILHGSIKELNGSEDGYTKRSISGLCNNCDNALYYDYDVDW